MNNFDKIDLNQLRVLATLLETRNVTRTALRHSISQPTASRILDALRLTFNDPLLIKTNAGMTLSQRAESLRQPLQQWLAMTRAFLHHHGSGPEQAIAGHIRVASTDYGVLSVLEPAMPQILQKAPELYIDVLPLEANNFNQLAMGMVDLVISGWEPEQGKGYEQHLFEEHFCAAFHMQHPLAQAGTDTPLSVQELLDWPHLLLSVHSIDIDPIQSFLNAHGLQRKVAARLPYLLATLRLLARTDAIGVVPRHSLHAPLQEMGLTARPLPPEISGFNYWLHWHERSRRDPVVMWFVEMLAQSPAGQPPASPAPFKNE